MQQPPTTHTTDPHLNSHFIVVRLEQRDHFQRTWPSS
jgi:hypothetical protein